jgi:hypothetical protein
LVVFIHALAQNARSCRRGSSNGIVIFFFAGVSIWPPAVRLTHEGARR